MTKIRYFVKGAHFMAEIILVFISIELIKDKVKDDEENKKALDEMRTHKRPYGPAPYSYKKHPKGSSVKPEEPKNPIGFGEYHD